MSQKTAVKPAHTPVPLQTASKAELIEQYNQLARSITSINASVTMQLTAGSTYTGMVEQYHEVTGFILAKKPADIRVIGQVPVVGKNIFDMESNGKVFNIFIPSKNQFLTGPANLERPSAKPIENLRPQHLIDAIFWQPIPKDAPVLLEETATPPQNFYVLTVVRAQPSSTGNNQGWEIARKIWFDRSDLSIARIDSFESGDSPSAIVRYSDWDMFGAVRYPRQILLDRPQSDYQLHLTITKLTANEAIEPERFALLQPEGSDLVRVGEEAEEKKP